MKLSKFLRKQRDTTSLRREAKEIGISHTALLNLENDMYTDITIGTLKLIAKKYRIDIHEVLDMWLEN